MNWHDIDPVTALIAAATFGLVLAAWGVVAIAYFRRQASRRDEIKARLDLKTEQSVVARELRLWHEGGEATVTVYDDELRLGPWAKLERQLAAAGFVKTPATILTALGGAAVAAGVLGFLATGRIAPAIVGAIAVVSVFWWIVGIRANRRPGLLERQLVDALELSARALRAGHPLLSSFQLIAEEIPAPIGELFGEVCQEHELGVDLETALRRMTASERNADLRLFTASLAINLRIGGNLAEVIEGIAKVIRERVRLQRKFRVLTAQTQISKRILTALPIAMFFVLNVLNPEYMAPMYDTSRGNAMLLVAACMLGGGWWVLGRMAAVTR